MLEKSIHFLSPPPLPSLSHTYTQKNIIGLSFLIGGYSVFAGFFYWFMNHAVDIFINNWQLAIGYVIVAGLISFGVLYWFGPVSNPRTFDLIQWSIQLIALLLISSSTASVMEVSAVVVTGTLLLYWLSPW